MPRIVPVADLQRLGAEVVHLAVRLRQRRGASGEIVQKSLRRRDVGELERPETLAVPLRRHAGGVRRLVRHHHEERLAARERDVKLLLAALRQVLRAVLVLEVVLDDLASRRVAFVEPRIFVLPESVVDRPLVPVAVAHGLALAEMPLADDSGVVPSVAHVAADRLDPVVYRREGRHPVLVAVHPRQNARAGRSAYRIRRVDAVELDSVFRERVHVRRLVDLAAVARHRMCAVVVGEDEEHVQPLGRGKRALRDENGNGHHQFVHSELGIELSL